MRHIYRVVLAPLMVTLNTALAQDSNGNLEGRVLDPE